MLEMTPDAILAFAEKLQDKLAAPAAKVRELFAKIAAGMKAARRVIVMLLLFAGVWIVALLLAKHNNRTSAQAAAKKMEERLNFITSHQWELTKSPEANEYGDVKLSQACSDCVPEDEDQTNNRTITAKDPDWPYYLARQKGDILSFERVRPRWGIEDKVFGQLFPRLETSSHSGDPP